MKLRRAYLGNERGAALYLVAVLMVVFMGVIGMAVDLGRGYIIRNALGTAVDGAALAAARALPQGQGAARTAAERIFAANFPSGFLGVQSVASPNIVFTNAGDGSSLITVQSSAVLPTTFMRVAGGGPTLAIASAGQATRRLVDMSFIIDRSGSLLNDASAVRTAAANFVGKFDDVNDRISLISFSSNTRVHSSIVQPGRGFAKSGIQAQITNLQFQGPTGTAEGLYQGWNQLRLVPLDHQSGLRVIVLFTDGAPNSYAATFPQVSASCNGDPDLPGGGWVPGGRTGTQITEDLVPGNPAYVKGLWNTYTLNADPDVYISPTNNSQNYWSGNSTNFTVVSPCIPVIPTGSTHAPQFGTSSGIPTSFPLYDGALPAQRGLIGCGGSPVVCANNVQNQNNAARNLSEVIANRIRNDDTGQAPIHIFTLGLGNLLNVGTGSNNETGASMLRRIANDPASPQYDASEPEGAYFFAGNPAQLEAAFEAIRDRLVRINQ